MKKQRGFNMIELLIVIAIIGILTALILAGTSRGRVKARDARIKSAIGQLRFLAESTYDTQGASYEGWTGNGSIQSELTQLLEDIDNNYGDTNASAYVTVMRDSQVSDFCISAPQRLQPGMFYCIDRTGVLAETSAACPDHPVDGPPLVCP